MDAIVIRNLSKSFGQKQAVCGLDMTVPCGAIYGFIGENGSGKSTTEKMICGLIPESGGSIRIFDKDQNNPSARNSLGLLIESPGCFPGLTVWNNMMLQAANIGLENAEEKVREILKTVRMEGAASNKYKNCSLGMKQRIGIAMALLGDPALLILDEPLNGLDADGMRIMREVLCDIVKDGKRTVLISSHLLPELQKIATHYGIIRHGKMIREMTAAQLDESCPTFVALKTSDMDKANAILCRKYFRVEKDTEREYLRVYDAKNPEEVVICLHENGVTVNELMTEKIGLEEYYINLMEGKR